MADLFAGEEIKKMLRAFAGEPFQREREGMGAGRSGGLAKVELQEKEGMGGAAGRRERGLGGAQPKRAQPGRVRGRVSAPTSLSGKESSSKGRRWEAAAVLR